MFTRNNNKNGAIVTDAPLYFTFSILFYGLPLAKALSAILTAFFSLQWAYFSLKVILIKLSIAPWVNKLQTLATLRVID